MTQTIGSIPEIEAFPRPLPNGTELRFPFHFFRKGSLPAVGKIVIYYSKFQFLDHPDCEMTDEEIGDGPVYKVLLESGFINPKNSVLYINHENLFRLSNEPQDQVVKVLP